MAVACNLIAKEIVSFVYNLNGDGRGALEWVSSRFKEDKDMTELIPDNLTIPSGLKGKVTTAVIRSMPQRVGDRCPAYDLILQNVYDMAEVAIRELARVGDEKGAKRMREVQIVAAFLGNDAVRTWYYKNVDKAIKKILGSGAVLHGGDDGTGKDSSAGVRDTPS